MEQIVHTFGIDWRLIAMQMFNFAVLLGALSYFLYKPVMRMLEERRRVIEKGVRDAEAATEKLAVAEDDAKAVREVAHKEAESIVARAKEKASEEAVEIIKEAQKDSRRLEEEIRARAEAEAARVRAESEREIARTALLAAERILREKT